MPHTHEITPEIRQCIQSCQECHAICLEMVQHSLHMGGPHAEPKNIRRLLDCAQICSTSADFMLRTSHFHSRTCGVCAEICRACAEECEKMPSGDEAMRRCAEACRRCEQSCSKMVTAST